MSSSNKNNTTFFFSRSSSDSESDGEKYSETGPPSKRRNLSPKPNQPARRMTSTAASSKESQKMTPQRTVSPRTHEPEIIDLVLSSDDDDDDRKMPARRVSTSPPTAHRAATILPKQGLKTAPRDSTVLKRKRSASTDQTSATASFPAAAAAPASAPTQTLAEWLKNANPEELERLNVEAMRKSAEQSAAARNAAAARRQQSTQSTKVKTLRRSSHDVDGNIERFLNKNTTNTMRISQDDDDSDATVASEADNTAATTTPYSVLMAGKSPAELEALNKQAIKLAMEGPTPVDYPYTLQEFNRDFIEAAERIGQLDQEELEHTKAVRDSNNQISKEESSEQAKAQYGRTMLTGGQVSSIASCISNLVECSRWLDSDTMLAANAHLYSIYLKLTLSPVLSFVPRRSSLVPRLVI
jgi:hypothetical protein